MEQLKTDTQETSHNHRLSRWLAQPYKGMVLAGLKAHRKRACAKFSVNTEEMWYNRERAQEGREKWEDQGNPRR